MKKADNFDSTKWLVENKITFQSRLNEAEELMYVEWDELEKMAFSAISAYNKENGLDSIQSVRVISSGNSYDKNKAIMAFIMAKTNTGKEMGYELTWDKDLNLSKLIPPYKSTNTPQPNKKQKDGDSKPISLTPEQKKEFKSAIRDLKKIEDLEYALGEAGNVLANILTNGKAEFIEDVEDFGYDADEVEQYAIDLASGSKLNEDLTDEIAALPNHHTAEDTEDATLVVGKYAVVRYDESDEGGEDMYVVWDNTVNQDEIGSYDDEPEFESTEPAEVAAFLMKNS